MSVVYRFVLFAFLLGVVGCGSGTPPMNNTKMTEAEIKQMQENDSKIEDEERSGSGTASANKQKK